MKKCIALMLCLWFTSSSLLYSNKESQTPTIQIKFSSTKIKQSSSNSSNEDMQSCLELLSNYAMLQEQRALTFEEMMIIMQILMFLFLQDTDDYSKKIDIALKNGKKITLPYSAQLFASVCQQGNQQESEED